MSYLIFLTFIVIGNLINIFVKKRSMLNIFVGLFLIWPLFFSISTFYFRSYTIVSRTFIVLLCVGFLYLLRIRNYRDILFTSLIVVLLLIFIMLISQFTSDLDSKNYLLFMSRLNFDSWGAACDKMIRIAGLAEHSYFMRLPYIGYGWVHNIFSAPLNPATAYIHSLLFYIFTILFLSHVFVNYIKIKTGVINKLLLRVASFIFTVGIIGPYALYSAAWGQMNQSYVLLLSTITIYLFNSNTGNKSLFMLITVISPLVLLSYPEFYFLWLLLYIFLVLSNKFHSGLKCVIFLLAPLSSLFILIPNFNKYYSYIFGQANLGLVVNLIDNPRPKLRFIYYFFQFFNGRDFFGFIDNYSFEIRNVIMNLFPIIIFGIFYTFISKRLRYPKNKHVLIYSFIGMLIYLLIYNFLVDKHSVINYQIFKYSGWTSWIVLFLWFIFSISFFSFNKFISKLLFFILLLVVTARIGNLVSLYSQLRINASQGIIKPVYLNKTQTNDRCSLKFNDNYISTVVSLGNYFAEKNNCVCLKVSNKYNIKINQL